MRPTKAKSNAANPGFRPHDRHRVARQQEQPRTGDDRAADGEAHARDVSTDREARHHRPDQRAFFVRLSNARATYHAARGVMIRRIMRRIANLAVVAAAVSVFLASEPHGPASCLCVELDTDLAWKTDCNPRTAAHQIEFGNIQLTDFGGVHFKLPLM